MTKLSSKLLIPHEQNPNECSAEIKEKIKASIQRFGRYQPLIVCPHPTIKDHFSILDGRYRWEILQELGHEEIRCQVWKVTGEEAKILVASLNRLRGTDDLQKRGKLLQSITEFLTPKELAKLVPESEAQINDLIRMMQADMTALEESFKAEMLKEQASLPVPYTFLIDQADQPAVEKAFTAFQEGMRDRGRVFVKICTVVMEKGHAQTSN